MGVHRRGLFYYSTLIFMGEYDLDRFVELYNWAVREVSVYMDLSLEHASSKTPY